MPFARDPAERFLEKVDRSGDCWLWTAALNDEGYAVFGHGHAHRFSYERARGAIPPGMVIDHLCRVRHCVNPDHLEAVTNKTNIRRGISRSAMNARKKACQNGHPFDDLNTGFNCEGNRFCRTCNAAFQRSRVRDRREYGRMYRARRKAMRAAS